jgi:hypothetical protein
MQAVYGPEQAVHLAVDPVKEVKGIKTAIAATDPEADGPEAARAVGSNIDGDRPMAVVSSGSRRRRMVPALK